MRIAPWPVAATIATASSKVAYSSAPHSGGIWSFTNLPGGKERWWIRCQVLVSAFGTSPSGELMKRFPGLGMGMR